MHYQRIRAHGFTDNPRKPFDQRFWEKVNEDGDECWTWTAWRDRKGYGKFGLGTNRGMAFAHRVAWELMKGQIPDGLCVLHACDNPSCCNPEHLFLGTVQDNLADMRFKGRQPRGETHGMAKLTEAKVRDIRARYQAGERPTKLAREYRVTYRHVWAICRALKWKHA